MAKQIILKVTDDHYNALLLQDSEIVEYHREKRNLSHIVGDIYLGTVKKLMPSLNAAFVGIGHEKDAFLHYSDLAPNNASINAFIKEVRRKKKTAKFSEKDALATIEKKGKISEVLKVRQHIIVQVSKEAIHSKGLRVTSCIALIGRYMILKPFDAGITISKKIQATQERDRLTQLISAIQSDNTGILIRTAARNKTAALLDQEYQHLQTIWSKALQALIKARAGTKLVSELSLPFAMLRDTLDDDFDQIIIDHSPTYEAVKAYLNDTNPSFCKILHLYPGPQDILQWLNLDKKLSRLFGTTVSIKGGGYLIIQQAEALWVIDVNSGSFIPENQNHETIALEVNLAAVREVARQLRLRDIGGIVVVDFISMHEAESKHKVYQAMKECLQEDPAQAELLPLSKFCIMEITRARVRPAVTIDHQEVCPTCYGVGEIQPPLHLVSLLEEQLKLLLLKHKLRNITIRVHPYLSAYLHQGFLSKKWTWFLNYRQWIHIVQDEKLSIATYQILNKNKEIVATNPRLNKAITTTSLS